MRFIMMGLVGIELFKDLPTGVMEAISRQFEEKSYKKGDTVYLEGDPAHHMWFVKSGRVHAAKALPNGFALTVCRVDQGCMFGVCCDFKTKQYMCQATAATDSVVVRIPIRPFLALVENNPGVSTELMTALAKRLGDAQHMRSMGQEPVEKRIAGILITLQKDHGKAIPYTRREIAEMVGTTVETSIRVLSAWEKKGVITSHRGSISVVKKQELEKISQAL
jgi:CRP/FNR family transcriptional regulator